LKKALFFKKLDNKVAQCNICSHKCKIAPGETGICGVRKNKDGDLYSLCYGITSGTGIDKIEKKPFFHFLPNSAAFSNGTIGCNFACQFCQNAWMSQCGKDPKIEIPPLYDLPPEKIVDICQKEDIPIIAYTYNEPVIYFEYTYDTAIIAHKKGIKNVYVSNGYATNEVIDKIAPVLDAINIDLKSFSDNFYRRTCKASLKPVLRNIKRYYEKDVWIEITTLIIQGANDSEKELTQIAEFIASLSTSIPWHVTRFSPDYKMKDRSPTPESTIKKAYDIGKKTGLKYVYAGNITSEDLHSTYCPKCKNLLVKRDWGYTRIVGLEKGKCEKCGEKIEGVWK